MAVVTRRALIIALLCTPSVFAQQPTAPATHTIAIGDVVAKFRSYSGPDQEDQYYWGEVELKRGDVLIYADEAWFYRDLDLFEASGNVVFMQGKNQISAEYAEVNTRTNLR